MNRDDAVADLEAFQARVGFEVALPTYLPEGVTPTFLYGFPLLPGPIDEPDWSAMAAVYGTNSGAFVLNGSTRLDRAGTGAGETVDVGGVPGQLERSEDLSGNPETTLTWRACGLAFSLAARTPPGAPTAGAPTDDELIRVAASIVEGCG